MSVSSLTKFTVPLNSDQSASAQGMLMPKLSNRFRVMFENIGVSTPRSELTKQVLSFSRPKLNFESIEIPVYNSKIYVAGKHTWETVSVTLRDDVNGSVSRLIGEQLQKQFDFMEQASASAGIDYKFVTRLEMTDGGNGTAEPNVLETWEMYGCFLTNVDYSEVNYSSVEAVQIVMTVQFDNAIQTPIGDGIGSAVARLAGSTATG